MPQEGDAMQLLLQRDEEGETLILDWLGLKISIKLDPAELSLLKEGLKRFRSSDVISVQYTKEDEWIVMTEAIWEEVIQKLEPKRKEHRRQSYLKLKEEFEKEDA